MKLFLLGISLLLLNTISLDAKVTKDKGFNGSLGYIYEDESFSIGESSNSENRFIQEYKLDYGGNIYNPKLLDYRLSGSLYFNDANAKNNNGAIKRETKSKDYSIDARFLNSTKFPIRIFYNINDRITSAAAAVDNNTTSNKSDRKDYGIIGSVRLEKVFLNYQATKKTQFNDSYGYLTEWTTTNYASSIDYTGNGSNTSLNIAHTIIDTFMDDSVNITTQSSENNSLDLSYNKTISKSLQLTSSLRNFESSLNDTTSAGARMGINWRPDADYSGIISIDINHVEYSSFSDVNATVADVLHKDTTININQNFSYRPIQELSFTQDSNYFSYDTLSSELKQSRLNLGMFYNSNKQLTAQRTLTLKASLRSIIQNTKTVDLLQNTSESEKTNQYFMQAGAGTSERFQSINSTLNTNIDYNGIRGSVTQSDQYNINLFLTSQIGRINNSLEAYYASSQSSTITRYADNIRYESRIGLNGSFSGALGYNVEEVQTNGLATKRERLNADANFRYNIFRGMSFSTNNRLTEDLSLKTLVYSSVSKLSYSKGLTEISLFYNYDTSIQKSIIASQDDIITTRNFLRAQFKRTF